MQSDKHSQLRKKTTGSCHLCSCREDKRKHLSLAGSSDLAAAPQLSAGAGMRSQDLAYSPMPLPLQKALVTVVVVSELRWE